MNDQPYFSRLLRNGYAAEADFGSAKSRLDFLSESIFDFTTYDGEMAELFGRRAVEVVDAITNRTTFDYIKDPEGHKWFLVMCNTPFFRGRINWGTSVRAAWWDHDPIEYQSCGLWDGDAQMYETMRLSRDEWIAFMRAIVEFAGADE